MRIDILTLFPEMFTGPFDHSIIKRAREAGILDLRTHDFRRFTDDRHGTVDDSPFGGGPGMVLKPGPVFRAVEWLRGELGDSVPLVYLSPRGRRFTQAEARELASMPGFILLSGRYEGLDQRVIDHLVDRELSIGDYVLSGGEPAAVVVVDAVARLLPGALGDDSSTEEESFSGNLLEYPQYTRPAEFRGWKVPEILLSGNHEAIRRWRREQSIDLTKARRPDLLNGLEDVGGSK
ncbi:MAG: tRNA (guanosine(37)-N1)-methyltransferase TrmD [Acidobacteriota bacterium]|jgi:tRNA (guanine37-N1)-methyltransferase